MAVAQRQALAGTLSSLVAKAIETKDQKYGRQLATMLERNALLLRAALGGTPMWQNALSPARPTPAAAETPAAPPVDLRVPADDRPYTCGDRTCLGSRFYFSKPGPCAVATCGMPLIDYRLTARE